jgi:anhydro-N-acetylmuramic acid kinase
MTPAGWLLRHEAAATRHIVGIMSGTSVDGVDAALVAISGSGRSTELALEAFVTVPFPDTLRTTVLSASHGDPIGAEGISRLSVALTQRFGDAVDAVLAGGDRNIDAIACHGQTVSHTPHGTFPATLQLANPAVLARRFGVPVVSDFRSADVADGGQGAPLVPSADWCLLTHPTKDRAVQNLGGIGNVTYLAADAARDDVLGFDTGPGNVLIDRAVQALTNGRVRFDENGWLAAQGTIDCDALEWLLAHPFLSRLPPKSAGREEFGEAYWKRVKAAFPGRCYADLLATLTEFTVLSIVDAYDRFLPTRPDEVILGGGGARNGFLRERLQRRLAPTPVRVHEEVGIDSDAKEAIAFALLANETLLGNPANLPRVTGARSARLLGSITFP